MNERDAHIEKTVAFFERKFGTKMTAEQAREAVENVTGFIKVLQEWARNENVERGGNKNEATKR